MRDLAELAAAAVDASQSATRTLTIRPSEYGLLIRDVQVADGRQVVAWDDLVFQVASERGLTVPLPDVKVIVDTLPGDGGRDALLEEAADGWEALEQHALEQGWDDDE